MIIEDYQSNFERNKQEVSCTYKELEVILHDLKALLNGSKKVAHVNASGLAVRFKLISFDKKVFPQKQIINDLIAKSFLNNGDFQDKIEVLLQENESLRRINGKIIDQQEMIDEMHSQFRILCEDPISEPFKNPEIPINILKEATLQVLINNCKQKNSSLEEVHKKIEWQIIEAKIIKQVEKQHKELRERCYNTAIFKQSDIFGKNSITPTHKNHTFNKFLIYQFADINNNLRPDKPFKESPFV
jgi:hypothetical protein